MLDYLMIVLGMIGTALVIGVYVLLQTGRISATSLQFSVFNAVGAFCIFVSIGYDFDPADTGGLLVEGAWCAVSLYGIRRALKNKRPAGA